MSATNLELKILTAENTLFSGQVSSVVLPGTVSPFEVLKDHASIISTLGEGAIIVKTASAAPESYQIKSGVVRVHQNLITACVEL